MGSQKFPALKIPGQNSFTGVFYKTLKELNHSQSSYKKKEEGTFPNQFYEAHITVIPVRKGHYQKRELQANIPDEYSCKNSSQNTSKLNSATHTKKDHGE